MTEGLPYCDECTCHCHSRPGVVHRVACCRPRPVHSPMPGREAAIAAVSEKFAGMFAPDMAKGLAAELVQVVEAALFHRSDELVEALEAYVKAYNEGTGTVYVNDKIRKALASIRQSTPE